MKSSKSLVRALTMVVLLLAGGCASAYHSYSQCRVNCRYCPPCPLPHCQYKECVCHSSAASKYLVSTKPYVVAESLPIAEETISADDNQSDTL